MDSEKYYLAIKAMETIEAQELLIDLQKSDYPQMKDQDRSRFHRRVVKKSDPFVSERIVNNEDLNNMFGANDIKNIIGQK